MQRLGTNKRFRYLFLSSLPVFFLLFISLSFGNQFVKSNLFFQNSAYINPFGENYRVLVPFFKQLSIKQHYKVSHEKITVELPDNSPILALSDALVVKNKIIDNWGVEEHIVKLQTNEYTFVFEGLKSSRLVEHTFIKQGDTIGYSGKIALYPSVKFTVYKNGKTVSPQKIIHF